MRSSAFRTSPPAPLHDLHRSSHSLSSLFRTPQKDRLSHRKTKNNPSIFAKNKRTFSEKSRDLERFSSYFQSYNKPKSTHNKSKQKIASRIYARISEFTFLPSPLHLSFYTSIIQPITCEHKRSIFLHLCTSPAGEAKD